MEVVGTLSRAASLLCGSSAFRHDALKGGKAVDAGTMVLQLMLSGLTVGAIYALVAVGFVLIYNVTGVLNFAQGEFAAVGALTGAWLSMRGLPLWVCVVLAVLVAAAVAAGVERAVVHPARQSRPMTVIMLTIGAGMALRGAALLVFGTDPLAMPMFTEGEPISIGGATILWQTVWALVLCLLFFAALVFFFEKTYTGKAVRANVMNRFAARLYGIRPTTLSFWVFVVGGAVSGLAGVVVAPITGATYDMGLMLSMKGFVAAVIGGLNNAAAAVVGAVLLGVVESLATGLLSSGYGDVISFALLLAMLLVRPSGLWSRAEGKRV